MANNLEFVFTAKDLASDVGETIRANTVKGMKDIGHAADELASKQKNLGNVSGQSRSALMSLSQTIQDAPFGIRGMGNNIEQLTAQMTMLASTTGGVKGAMSALMASFTGPAGILFLVSSAISLWTMYSMSLEGHKDKVQKVGSEYKTLKELLQELTTAQNEYTGSLKGTNDAIDNYSKKELELIQQKRSSYTALYRDLTEGTVKTYSFMGRTVSERVKGDKEESDRLQESFKKNAEAYRAYNDAVLTEMANSGDKEKAKSAGVQALRDNLDKLSATISALSGVTVNEVVKTDKELEAEREKHNKKIDALVNAQTDLEKIGLDNQVAMTVDATSKQIAEETRLHETKLNSINDIKNKYPELLRLSNIAIENEQKRHAKVLDDISMSKEMSRLYRPSDEDVTNAKKWSPSRDQLKRDEDEARARAEVYRPLTDALNSGFSSMGRTIHLKFIDELIQGKNVFGSFVGGVLSGLEQIAQKMIAMSIVNGIMSLFTGGIGGVASGLGGGSIAGGGAVGGMMGRTSFNSNSLNSLTSFGGGSGTLIRIEGRFTSSGRDLISTFKEARIIDRKLGGNL